MAETADPRYVYKLVPSTAPVADPVPDQLPVSELDQTSGFFHLSTAKQVPNTLKIFFKNEPRVYVLRIEYEPIKGQIRWESPDGEVCGPRPGEGLFPHLYNGFRLGRKEVESVAVWDNQGGWDKALAGAEDWLLY
ncbi:hypothetical protein ASPZODRAFT_131906 [Penicilliopsis zonata CBS 506.65]|uniref:DUF952 domain-containing protein n=1 Tax=Penicilliopsis zonata CBS 506.65 TaxID=1073090 RepID=A0A1L9SIE6_9EURO|nr:hypothetical protein ASPZODRAFT_131906 [Penicilliopsis zonata CBS 506.65]OJJ46989.1 hypothetical protein ASPZODRAFT_131906 [Penicilliopsis zonata CBS 506.65]